jgi:predicted nucleic acid-binding protein
MAILVDTGILYALFDRADSWHKRVASFLRSNRDLLLAPAPVLPETAYLLRQRGGPARERQLLSAIASREVEVEALELADYERALELTETYSQIGFVDASVVAVAERLNLRRLLTTDRRHFSVVRPRHVEALELVP